jgi:hypothetical protein
MEKKKKKQRQQTEQTEQTQKEELKDIQQINQTAKEKENEKENENEKEKEKEKEKIIPDTNHKVQEITLEYLCNSKSTTTFNGKTKTITSDKNKKFYRKRIIQLTKNLLEVVEEKKTFHPPDVRHSFQKYIESCIDHFQTIDRTDLLQEDYKDLEDSLASLDNLLEPSILESSVFEANQRLMRSINMKTNTLDGLVKRTVIKKEEPILPKKKKINLKDPELKNKGIIGKKDNLTNN